MAGKGGQVHERVNYQKKSSKVCVFCEKDCQSGQKIGLKIRAMNFDA